MKKLKEINGLKWREIQQLIFFVTLNNILLVSAVNHDDSAPLWEHNNDTMLLLHPIMEAYMYQFKWQCNLQFNKSLHYAIDNSLCNVIMSSENTLFKVYFNMQIAFPFEFCFHMNEWWMNNESSRFSYRSWSSLMWATWRAWWAGTPTWNTASSWTDAPTSASSTGRRAWTDGWPWSARPGRAGRWAPRPTSSWSPSSRADGWTSRPTAR